MFDADGIDKAFGESMTRRGGMTAAFVKNVLARRKAEQKHAAAEEKRKLREEMRKRLEQEVARRQTALDRSIDQLAKLERPKTSYRLIERRACYAFGVTPKEIKSVRRQKDICFARQFVMYWAARLTSLSYPAIGRLMGGRDHTTVLHGRKAYVAKRAAMGRYLRQVR